MNKDLQIEILKQDYCTEKEAMHHLEKGTVIYEGIGEYIDYLKETVNGSEKAFIEEYGSKEEIEKQLRETGRHFDSPLINYNKKEYVIVYSL
jgi:hypothetical protein